MSNKLLLSMMAGAALSLAASPSMASIEQECAASGNHAKYVCEYIYDARQEMADIAKPPEPFVSTQLGTFENTNLDYSAPADESSGGSGSTNPFGQL